MSIEKIIELEVRADKAEKDLDGIAKGVQKIDKNLEDVKDSSNVAAKGIKGIGTALKAAGIGLAIAAFSKLVEVFNQNQKVADAFSIVFESLSLAFNDFFNYIDKNAGGVIDYFKAIFEDPKQALKDFADAFKKNIQERFDSYLDTLGYLASAVKKVFSGDFAGALDDVKSAGKESLDVLTGVNNSFDKSTEAIKNVVKSTSEYIKENVKAAKSNVDLTKSAEVAAVMQQGLVEKYDRQAELQRQIRDDESKSIEERVAANTKLGEILDEQEAAMLSQVNIQLQAAQAQYDKNQNQENYIALLEAQNEKEGVLAQLAGFRSEQLTNINSLERERVDLIKEATEAELDFYAAAADAAIKSEADKKKTKEEATKAAIEQDKKALGSIVQLAGKGSAIGKAAAVAQVTTAGIEGVQNAYKTAQASPITAIFPAYPVIQAGLAAAFAGVQLKSILATKKPSLSGSGGGGGSASAPRVPKSTPPAFNVVGASETNQLAQAIGQDEKQPIKAFVVSNDVSDAQSLDRNIIESASIG
jgi:hypothetical protein